jgi:glycine cleavage system H lipoate-binding protein
MKHNYADWELTQLLPESPQTLNKDNHSTVWLVKSIHTNGVFIYITDGVNDTLDSLSEDEEGSNIREAWTWEDIRLYLKSKGYIIEINTYITEDITKVAQSNYDFVILDLNNMTDDFKGGFSADPIFSNSEETYMTYEEARINSIKYCLQKIKENG